MMKQYKLLALLFFLLTSRLVFSQQELRVSGRVLDEQQMPLPGAAILAQGTDRGVVSDLEGRFTLNLPKDRDLLQVSFIGYVTQIVAVGKQTDLTIQMVADAKSLDEVIVTALGITKKEKKVGYSTQKIQTDALEEMGVSNVGNLFSGQVAGLAVDNPTGLFQAPKFSLRGKTPLVVIDDIPVETNFYDVSPNDIADINVLKGTTASALYGSRGRNGAILITTKSAKTEGMRVNISHNTMFSAGFSVFPKTQTEYGNGSNGKYEFWDGKDGGISDGDMIWGPKFTPGLKVKQWNSPIYDKETKKTIPWWGDVAGTQYNDKSRYSRVPIPWQYHNNLKDFLQTAYIATTNFSITHKSKKSAYLLSGNYTKHKDRVPHMSLKRGGLTFKSSSKLTERLTLDTKLAYNKVFSPNYPRHGYGPKNHMYTILIWMGDDVNGKDLKAHPYVPGQYGYRQANFNYAWYNNVYFASSQLSQRYDANVVNGQMQLRYALTEALSLQGKVSLVNRHRFEDRKSPKSYLNYDDPRDGDYKTWNRHQMTLDYYFLATFDKALSDKFSVTANLGASSFYKRKNREYNATDGLVVPFVYSLNNTKGSVKGENFLEKRAINSLYGTISFDIYNAFFLTLAARNDWSSTLPENNRAYFYPSVSLSTMLSNLIEMPKAIDFLKIYGSWATVSNDLDPYQIESYYKKSGSFGNKPKLTYPVAVVGSQAVIVNKQIKPERTTSYELGLSTAFLNNRLGFDLTYYNAIDDNQIIDLPISKASGFGTRKVNGNEYTTKGLELVLTAKPIQKANLSWQTTLNWSTKVTRLSKIYGEKSKYNQLSLNERTDNLYGTVWQKSPAGALILDKKGLPIKDPYPQLLGHEDPKWRLGFQNTVRYKKFTFGLGIDGLWGGVFRSVTVEKMWWGGKHPNSTEFRDAEYRAGKPIYKPQGVRLVSGELSRDVNGNIIADTRVFKESTTLVSWQTWSQNYPYRARVTEKESKKFANILDRTFFKLRTISVKYDLSHLVQKYGLKQLSLSLNGYNLLIWKKAQIVDPDFGNDRNLQDPSTRYFGIGVHATF